MRCCLGARSPANDCSPVPEGPRRVDPAAAGTFFYIVLVNTGFTSRRTWPRTTSSSGCDHATIDVDDHAALQDFVAALDRAPDRRAFTDCVLLVNLAG